MDQSQDLLSSLRPIMHISSPNSDPGASTDQVIGPDWYTQSGPRTNGHSKSK